MGNSFRIPDSYWYFVEDGCKRSPYIYTLTSLMEYIHEHDFSQVAIVYWGPLDIESRSFKSCGGMFLVDFLSAIA